LDYKRRVEEGEDTDISDDEEVKALPLMALTFRDRGLFNCFTNSYGGEGSNIEKQNCSSRSNTTI
jgi:hypothetical protein